MSMNKRVTGQARVLGETYGTDRYEAEREKYWQILEEEARKDPLASGWLGWEDPVDFLIERIADGDDKELVAEVLADFKRFNEICERAGHGGGTWNYEKVVATAEKYIETGEIPEDWR